jgi:predicted nucleic acid-binding Zn ribbon protein
MKHKMSMMTWYATEGGRKCPMCGRYARARDLGNLSFYTSGSVIARISVYGHLPGRGCNKKIKKITNKKTKKNAKRTTT